MTLYEINKSIEEILSRYIDMGDHTVIDADTGELIEDPAAVLSELDALQVERSEKLEGIACWIKGMDAEVEAIKAEEKKLKERRDKLSNKRENVFAFLERSLAGETIKTARVKVSYRSSYQTIITDDKALPEEYLRIKTTTEPDKTAIKKAISAGTEVPGAKVVEVINMSIK